MNQHDNILQIKDLSISWQTEHGIKPSIKNISFDVPRGKTVALVGESGGGKTITSLAILQLLSAAARVSTKSEILLDGKNLLDFTELQMQKIRGRRIAMIFQEAMTALNPVFTIGHQIDEVLRKHFKLTRKSRQQTIIDLLQEVGLKNPQHIMKSYAHQLSGGMRQRAMIAMALAGKPDLLIADEPTTALDVTIQAQVLELLKKLQQKHNMSIIFITHDLGVVKQIADEVVVLYQGEIAEKANAKDFFAHPQSDYSKKLFAAIPGWDKRTQLPQAVSPNEKPLLQVDDLKIYFPIRKGILQRTVGYIKAVDDVSFNLYSGRTLALVGESGSGKTTAGKGIMRLLPITDGKVKLHQRNLASLKGSALRLLREQMQMVFQDPYASLNPRMIVRDIIAEGMAAQKIPVDEQQKRINELLPLVNLPIETQWRYPHEFSGGQRQRICIARSLAVNPQVIVCDEPTSSLDVSVQMQILKLLQDIQKKLGLAYLFITHNFSVVAYLADDVAVMHEGKIVEYGSVEEVLQRPQHEYTKKLLAAVPTV